MKKNINLLQILKVLLYSSIRIVYFIPVAVIFFLLAYLLGNKVLHEPTGGDFMYHVNVVSWYARWFPHIPLWYPLQGAGISLLFGYPSLLHLTLAAIYKLFNVNFYQVIFLAAFLSYPLTALGIYFYVWLCLKNQTVALISGVFYLLSAITWYPLFQWGFVGESLSYVFIPIALLFYDRMLSYSLHSANSLFTRLWFMFSALSVGILFLAHPNSLLGTLIFLAFFTVVFPLTQKKSPFRILTVWINGLLNVITAFCLVLFYEINVLHYFKTAGTLGRASAESLEYAKLNLYQVLSLFIAPAGNDQRIKNGLSFAVPVWSLAVIGCFLAILTAAVLIINKQKITNDVPGRVATIGLYCILAVIYIFYAPLFLARPLMSAGAHYRPIFTVFNMLLPVLAGYGAWILPSIIVNIVTFWKKYLGFATRIIDTVLNKFLVPIIALAIAVFSMWFFRSYLVGPYYIRYGPDMLATRELFSQTRDYCEYAPYSEGEMCRDRNIREKINFSRLYEYCSIKKNQRLEPDFCKKIGSKVAMENLLTACNKKTIDAKNKEFCQFETPSLLKQLNPLSWPKLTITDDIEYDKSLTKGFKDILASASAHERVDMSAGMAGLTQEYTLWDPDVSQVSLYAYQAHLSGGMWGYEQAIMYLPTSSQQARNNLANLYGIQDILIPEDLTPVDKYANDPLWKRLGRNTWEFLPSPKLYNWYTDKPFVLVIGSKKLEAYDTFFRAANEGIINYDEGLLVRGKEKIDDYELAELSRFSVIVLFGYSYNNRGSAFKLLDEYLKKGGSVFISTGWQYFDRDWETKNTPDFFPAKSLVWDAENTYSVFSVNDPKVAEGVNTDLFGSLTWSNTRWGISLPKGDLREWAKTYLSIDGKTLVAGGAYKKGKVIWTGLNFPGHIFAFKSNLAEITFMHNIFSYLLAQAGTYENDKEININRTVPDKVTFTFRRDNVAPSMLYFRESYHPDWRAKLVTENGNKSLPIYKAGPDLMLIALPSVSVSDRLMLQYDTGIRGLFGNTVSILTLLLLISYTLTGNRLFNFLKVPYLINLSKLRLTKVSKNWQKTEDDDY